MRSCTIRALWGHLWHGLIAYGACMGGTPQSYREWTRDKPVAQLATGSWDWSIPHQWYNESHHA